ncbi:MAG: hypothetical protein AAFZ02_05905, partial [Pseudomonadota bacterium]
MGTPVLELTLFGACGVKAVGASGSEVTGAKHKALFAILATAPNGRATRTHLQQMLWGRSSYDGGQQSLRRALSDIKRALGAETYDAVIAPTNAEITLDMSVVKVAGQPGRGAFLEGLEIPEVAYERWRDGIRANPDQIYALFGPTHTSPTMAVLPCVSILPFRVVFGEEQHGVLGDWLAEQICRSMSRSRLVAVISHMSARNLATTSVALDDVRAKLAVDYCLTGSIRASGDKIFLDADFLDARTGRILWTRHFEGTMAEFISGESAAEFEIVSAIGRAIASDAIQHTAKRRLRDIEDHHLLIAGVGKLHQLRFSSFVESREMIKEAIRRAPQTAEAHGWLADWYVKSVFNGWSTDRQADINHARDATARALDIDPENAFALTMDGTVSNTLMGRADLANKSFDYALTINPNEALCHLQKGVLHAFNDEAMAAVTSVKTANRLSPTDPFGYFYNSMTATAYLSNEQWQDALTYAEKSLHHNDRHTSTLRAKLTALYMLGRVDEAHDVFQQLLRRDPDFTVEHYAAHHPAAAYRTGQTAIKAMRAL